MSQVKLFFGEVTRTVPITSIQRYEANFKQERFPVITTSRERVDISYLLQALYRQEPLVINEGNGRGELLSSHHLRRIQLISDTTFNYEPKIADKFHRVQLVYTDGEEIETALELVHAYDVSDPGSRNVKVSLKKSNGCEPLYIQGSMMRGEPLLLSHEFDKEPSDIVSLHGISKILINHPSN